ncbi:hypothetical protein BJ138DRAFT_1184541 [Hygrophoropsis aurantiaca]|uniref:Uncharacterized protein n=1 Tax=Hygrophoropsis aurantiaca TaxID=72124 RepID=A0ACB7ZPU1_9AGAM|nr:hypothetical protein BJ138DRAFT_1184541 [Hygrophoropsis aurantiaca]
MSTKPGLRICLWRGAFEWQPIGGIVRGHYDSEKGWRETIRFRVRTGFAVSGKNDAKVPCVDSSLTRDVPYNFMVFLIASFLSPFPKLPFVHMFVLDLVKDNSVKATLSRYSLLSGRKEPGFGSDFFYNRDTLICKEANQRVAIGQHTSKPNYPGNENAPSACPERPPRNRYACKSEIPCQKGVQNGNYAKGNCAKQALQIQLICS